jgi:hypothetical protein
MSASLKMLSSSVGTTNSRLLELESSQFDLRMRAAVSLAWRLFSRKVGDGLLVVHKEASMQLQYAYLLQQLLPLLSFHPDEAFWAL